MGEKTARRTAAEVAELRAAELAAVQAKAARLVAQAEVRAERAQARAEAALVGTQKREDDRVKVLVGACVGHALSRGRAIAWGDAQALLDELGRFLVRAKEREAVLGGGHGSDAFWRVCGAAAEDQGGI